MEEYSKHLHFSDDFVEILELASQKLETSADLDPLMDLIGNSRYVLLGEASHGTHEYYMWRMEISKRLIVEKKFNILAVEGDWPDCYRVNRYIKAYQDSGNTAVDVLKEFNRWPTWMWANWEVVAFVEWLRKYNTDIPSLNKVGFYGLDVYSLWESMEAVLEYLEKTDPKTWKLAKKSMDCFDPYNAREGFSYADMSYWLTDSCEKQLNDLLMEIRKKMIHYDLDNESVFSLEQNALILVNAEKYYRVMLRGGDDSWNIRDRHMSETLNRLMKYYGDNSKVIVWEHNTHIGDARATDLKKNGLINVGQLVKKEHNDEGVVRVGFGSYEGRVLAAYHWGGKMEKMHMPNAIYGSWEHRLHEAGAYNKLLLSKDILNFKSAIGHREIGVVYDPDFEFGNYIPSIVPSCYEAFIFLNKTQALHSLHVKPDGLQMPITYPWGV